jgi:Uncharacterised nucleotidyltransferase
VNDPCPAVRDEVDAGMVAILRGHDATDRLGDSRFCRRLAVRARQSGLSGLLLDALDRSKQHVPDELADALRRESRFVADQNERAMTRLARIAETFARADVDMLVLKGAALVQMLYANPGHRPMCDIDLLVRSRDAAKTDVLLQELGFVRGRNLLRKDFYPRFHYEADYEAVGPHPLRLDVHVRPWRPLRYAQTVCENAFRSDARALHSHEATIRVPSPTNMLIHLLCHAAFHGCGRLLWLIDIHRFAKRYGREIDWTRFIDNVNAWHLTHAARLAADASESVFGRFLPADVRDHLRTRRIGWRDRMTVYQSPRDFASPVMRTITDMLCTPGVRFRLGYLRAVMLPDRNHLAETYGSRHAGWMWCALARRALLRPLARALHRQRVPHP